MHASSAFSFLHKQTIAPIPLPSLVDPDTHGIMFFFKLMISLTLVTLMLSLAGVYAVTAFAVARRTREIGVRVVLGARPLDVLTVVFKCPLTQVGMGMGIGVGAFLGFILVNDDLSKVHFDVLGSTVVFTPATMVCCALASVVPTRRALRIQPMEALRDES